MNATKNKNKNSSFKIEFMQKYIKISQLKDFIFNKVNKNEL